MVQSLLSMPKSTGFIYIERESKYRKMPWIYGDCYMHIYVSDVFNVTFDHSTLSHVISKECYNHRLQNEPKQNITMWKAKP